MGFLRDLFFPIDADEQAYKRQQKDKMRYERDLQKQKEKDRIEFEKLTLKRKDIPHVEVKEYDIKESTRSFPISASPLHYYGSARVVTNLPQAYFTNYHDTIAIYNNSIVPYTNENITLGYHNSKL